MTNALVPGDVREAMLTRIMDVYGSSVLRVCYLYLRDYALAQDAAQTTFMKVWQSLDTLRSGATEKAWVMRIAVNTCKNMLKSRDYRQYAYAVDFSSLPEPAAEAVLPDDTVLRAVLGLPEKYRMPVVLHYYQSLSLKEAAQVLETPQVTVRTRLHRARHLLYEQLEGWYFDE
ncbi:MAG: sigma-70 family RNA polymerase sigma factor [Clostridia bacterium]|nr:sigma-70 family RNA polymerase sigma factor [Clostridia bacterium]